MNEDEQRELIALIGGEDCPVGEWPDGVPNAAGQLEEKLSIFGRSCADVEDGRP